MPIHCHHCKVIYDICVGTKEERAFIRTNLFNSEPDLVKLYFCTLDCLVSYEVENSFRPVKVPVLPPDLVADGYRRKRNLRKPTDEEIEEQKKEFADVKRAELLRNPAIAAYVANNEFVDKVSAGECEIYEEVQSQENFHAVESEDWADT